MPDMEIYSVLEELVGDPTTQHMLDKTIEEEDDAEISIMGDPSGISDSDAIDMVAGLEDPGDPDFIDLEIL